MFLPYEVSGRNVGKNTYKLKISQASPFFEEIKADSLYEAKLKFANSRETNNIKAIVEAD